MTYFILKIALSNMNRPMSSQELVAILTLTDIKGSFSTSTHYLQRGSPKTAYCMVIFNKYTLPPTKTESHFIAQASLECTTMLCLCLPKMHQHTQLTSHFL